ncbi:MAG: hypothetical protein H6735_22425 [Alphaproteobacteria bacterium]|nr:hypothetical protein [Alphaproteobacteria bacterium]
MGKNRRSAPAPSTQQQGGGRRPGGQQFQPPTTSGAGSQMGGGPGLLDQFEQPGGSNEFMQQLMGQQRTDFA